MPGTRTDEVRGTKRALEVSFWKVIRDNNTTMENCVSIALWEPKVYKMIRYTLVKFI